MSNQYYTHGSFPSTGAAATSASMRAELDLVSAGFDKLPGLTGNANKFVVINSTATGLTTTDTLPVATVNDNAFTFQDEADNSRKFQFRADGISPGATRYFTMPDADTTLVGTDTTQTLTNKTLTSPVIGTIVNTGTLTLPTSTDTLVGRNTTDTLTNKTLTNPVISQIINTGTLVLPTTNDTLVGRATSDTLTNKTISGATNVLSNIANASLSNSAVTIGSSSLSLGGTLTALQGVSISGAVNTLTNIPNTALTNSGVTFNGTTVALGGSATIKASTTNALTIGNGLSGTSFDGGSAVTIAINTGVTADLSTAQTFSNKTISGAANTLTNIGNASLTNSAVTIGSTSISLGATATALAGLSSVTVTGDPTSALQLATKQYVDNVAQGLNVKASVAWSTTANISLLGLATQVGGEWPSALNAGDRILVKNQTVASQNGIYAASATGWSRTADADTWNELVSAFVFVSQGATMGDTGWVCTADPGGTLGTNNLPWSQFSGAGTYTAGTGLSLTGTQFSIDSTVTTLTGSQTLTNKTLTSPVISTIVNTGTLTLPTSTDTLVGRATTDTLTNKTISGSSNTLSNIANSSLTNSAITIGGSSVSLGGSISSFANDFTINGLTVGRGAGAVSTNTAVGASALAANTTAVRNTGVGYQALKAAVDGGYNVAIGSYAGSAITSGVQNTAVGDNALANATTAVNNTGIGEAALAGNTTGGSNTAVGQGSLQANTTASSGTAVGYRAAYANTTGDQITAVGNGALFSNTTGNYNVAVGSNSLVNNTTGASNTALGLQALQANTTASNNTAVGYQAGYSNTTDLSNTYIGAYAGYTANSASGTSTGNTFVGAYAGYNVTTGRQNTFIGGNDSSGYASGYFMTTGSKNTILGKFSGNQGGLDIRTANNYIVLSDGDGNIRAAYNNARGTFTVNSPNAGISRIEGFDGNSATVGVGSTLTISSNELGAAMVSVYDNASGWGAVFFASYISGTSIIAQDGSGGFATSDTAGKLCLYKVGGSHTLTFKNNTASNVNISIVAYAAQISY